MEQDAFYIGVREPIEIRRNILEASKLIIQNLQRYEKIKYIREEKLKKTAELKKNLRDIKLLSSKLRKELPKTEFNIKTPGIKKRKTVEKESEIRKLEKELGDVEKELSKLG